MKFTDKYTTEELKSKDDKEKDKVSLSNDAYALGEVLEELKIKIEHVRVSLIK